VVQSGPMVFRDRRHTGSACDWPKCSRGSLTGNPRPEGQLAREKRAGRGRKDGEEEEAEERKRRHARRRIPCPLPQSCSLGSLLSFLPDALSAIPLPANPRALSRPFPLVLFLFLSSCSNCWLLPSSLPPFSYSSFPFTSPRVDPSPPHPLHSFRNYPKRQNLVVPSPILYTCDSLRPKSFRERPPHPLKPSKQRHRHGPSPETASTGKTRCGGALLPYINTATPPAFQSLSYRRPPKTPHLACTCPFTFLPARNFAFCYVCPQGPWSPETFLPGATHALISRGTTHDARPNPHHLAPSPTKHLSDRPSSGETSHSPAQQ
jgi:hypothetical protein